MIYFLAEGPYVLIGGVLRDKDSGWWLSGYFRLDVCLMQGLSSSVSLNRTPRCFSG